MSEMSKEVKKLIFLERMREIYHKIISSHIVSLAWCGSYIGRQYFETNLWSVPGADSVPKFPWWRYRWSLSKFNDAVLRARASLLDNSGVSRLCDNWRRLADIRLIELYLNIRALHENTIANIQQPLFSSHP